MRTVDNGEQEVQVSAKVDTVFFMMERDGNLWTPASKILHCFETEQQAEAAACQMKETYPQRHFGVAVLRSEARHVAKPVEIVRVVPPPEEPGRPFA